MSKVESRTAIDNIDDIIRMSDGVMVARGDLGVEVPAEEVPALQKMVIRKCQQAGKPVVTATQMLESMMNNPRPTRAETSDIANAILDGTDGIMLSGETAGGMYPVEAVETMARVAVYTESQFDPVTHQDTGKRMFYRRGSQSDGRRCALPSRWVRQRLSHLRKAAIQLR